MKKLILATSLLLIGIALLCYAYFSNIFNHNTDNDLALSTASKNASIIFSYQNNKSFYQILEGQDLIQKIIGPNKQHILGQFKTNFIDNEGINALIKDEEIYLSLVPDENKEINFMITAEINLNFSENQIKNALKQNGFSFEKIKQFYKINFKDSSSVYLYFNHQIFSASSSLPILESSILPSENDDFKKFIQANNKNRKNILASLYLNYNHLPSILKNILTDPLNGQLEMLKNQNSFASLNYNFSKSLVLFNGTTEIKDKENYLKTFESESPQVISIVNILPENTANYTIYAYNDFSSWSKKLDQWFIENKATATKDNLISKVKEDYRVDLEQIFPKYSKNQFSTFQLSTGEKIGAILLSNGNKVGQLLLELSTAYDENIRQFKPNDVLYKFYGLAFKPFNRPYFTIIDNYLIVANYASTINSFLNNYKNNRLLIQNTAYLNSIDHISSTANLIYYVNFKNSNGIFKKQLNSDYFNYYNSERGLNYFDSFIYQMSTENNKFNTNLLIYKYPLPE